MRAQGVASGPEPLAAGQTSPLTDDDERFRALHTRVHEDQSLTRCRRCGYVTFARTLDEAELWHYVRTGESRFDGCPMHPWGWHYWDKDEKPPPVYGLSADRFS